VLVHAGSRHQHLQGATPGRPGAVRFHSRPEIVFREVVDVEPATVALAWLDRSSGPLVNALLDLAREQADVNTAASAIRPEAE
jgi:hypothetical protein